MTARHLPIGKDRLRHVWTCTRRGAVVERATRDTTGAGRIELVCSECGASDDGGDR